MENEYRGLDWLIAKHKGVAKKAALAMIDLDTRTGYRVYFTAMEKNDPDCERLHYTKDIFTFNEIVAHLDVRKWAMQCDLLQVNITKTVPIKGRRNIIPE